VALRRTSRFSGPRTRSTSRPMVQHEVRQPSWPDDRLQPGQQRDGADADSGEGDADGQAAPAHEPVGKVKRLRGEGHEVCAATDQDAERRIELPRFFDRGGEEKSGRQQAYAAFDHHAWAMSIHPRGPRSGSRLRRRGSRRKKAPATTPRCQPNSSISGGSKSEKAVRALTAIAMVTNAMPTISQP